MKIVCLLNHPSWKVHERENHSELIIDLIASSCEGNLPLSSSIFFWIDTKVTVPLL
jgi:hypothetical protein